MNYKNIILSVLVLAFTTTWINAQTAPDQQNLLQFTPNQMALVPVSTDSLNPGSEYTLTAWVYFYQPEPWAIFMGKSFESRHVDPWHHFSLSVSDAGDKICFSQSTGAAGSLRAITSTSSIQPYHWLHVAASLKNDTMRLYINGMEEAWGLSSGNPSHSGVPFSLGAAAPLIESNCCGFSGVISQAGIWDVALNGPEILMYADSALTGNEPGLRAFWPLDEGSGQMAYDITPNQIHLQFGHSSGQELLDPQWIGSFVVSKGPFFKRHYKTMPDTASNYADFYVFDYNSDGTDDLITTTVHVPPTVPATYQPLKSFGCINGNLSNTTTSVLGWVQMVQPRHTTVNDFNNDGLNDIFIVGHGTDTPPYGGEQSLMLIQTPSGTLSNETALRVPASSDFTHHVSSGDINGDGFPDVFMDNVYGGTHGPRVYSNNASGILSVANGVLDPTVSAMTKKFTSCCFFDADNDGDTDLFLGGHGGLLPAENFPFDVLYLNDGNGNFNGDTAILPPRSGGSQWGTLAVACADFDHNGFADLLLSVHNLYTDPTVQLLLNNGNLTFSDATHRIPLTWDGGNGHLGWIDTADFNNDGWMDFLLSKGGDIFTHRLYLNNGQARFTDVSYLVPFTLPDIPAARPGRFDADSDADIIIVWQNQYCFFENFNNFENSIATISPSGEILVPDTSSFSLTLNANTGNNLTYKWLHNQQEIAGATTSSYTAHQAGDYRVIVQHDVYPADTSLICHIGQDPLAIGENSLQNLQISPNPSNGIFRISGIIDQGHDYMIEMFDNNGNCRLISQCKSYATELDASGLPCGLYLIRISNTHQSRCLKIIIL